LDKTAAFALSALGVEVIGIDSESIGTETDDFEVHRQLLLNNIVIIEGLDLSGVQSGDYGYSALPIKISGADAAPCRVVLFKK
ncbi:MAG: cyclase family protein, partial [Acutalibacteraceae bacterium]